MEGPEIENLAQMKDAARALHERGAKCVLLKGGHITDGSVDIFFDGDNEFALEGRRIDTPHTHGTGCTLSSAIAAGLALGESTIEAVRKAKDFIQGAIENALAIGNGRGPLNHMYRQRKEESR